ncbi:MAG: insulinase family protein [Stomatobaculum sp.]|nr:insulinase family protein [Stomatobaculum sp.]
MYLKRNNKWIPVILSLTLLITGCAGTAQQNTTAAQQNTTAAQQGTTAAQQGTAAAETKEAAEPTSAAAETNEAADPYTLPEIGETISGFTVTERGSIPYLNAETASFIHEKSGLTLFLVENEDPDLCFQICFRVPHEDYTDTAHIFEHSIISSSDKYPSKNTFFDMVNKSYNTFINAFTYPIMTCYPVASKSQEQLEKMADVTMSCMAAPGVLKDEHYFKREAVRCQLYSKDDPITMEGTVFSEDIGCITDPGDWIPGAVFEAMYPGTLAKYVPGKLYIGYKDLEYAHLQEIYDRYYSYDNAIVLLYGKMDYARMLSFLDETWLSKAEKAGKNALNKYELEPKEGASEIKVDVPAFEGDTTEQASVIGYNVDLSDFTDEELAELSYLAAFLRSDSSPFKQKLRKKGIYNPSSVSNDAFSGVAVQTFAFTLENAEPEQAESFKEVVLETLSETAEQGLPASLIESTLHAIRLQRALSPESTSIGAQGMTAGLVWFMLSGRTDYYELEKQAEKSMSEETAGERVKALCKKLLEAKTTCLITASPKPGLAEEMLAEQEQYLQDMKDAMTDEELDAMISSTLEFDEWNASVRTNSDFLVDPASLPAPERDAPVTCVTKDGVTMYSAPAEIRGAAQHKLYFDTSALTKEELFDLNFFLLGLGEMGTEKYPREELPDQLNSALLGLKFTASYPGEEGTENHRPMMEASWVSMTEDTKKALELVLEVLQKTDFHNAQELLELLGRCRESYNPATQDGFTVAQNLSTAYMDDDQAYTNYLNGPEFYHYLKDMEAKLQADSSCAEEIAGRMEAVREKIVGKTNLIYALGTEEGEISRILDEAAEILKALPENEIRETVDYGLAPEPASAVCVYLEAPSQFAVLRSDLELVPEMKGRHYPFFDYLDDQYLVPELRFKGGAYSGGMRHSTLYQRIAAYSYRDPNTGKTLDTLHGMAEGLKKIPVDQDGLTGYINKCYGAETAPLGALQKAMNSIQHQIEGLDMEAAYERKADIRKASADDFSAFCEMLDQVLQNSVTVMTGNRKQMEADQDRFDSILDYQKTGE